MGLWASDPGSTTPAALSVYLSADVDECASGHSSCEHHCANLAGSFQCFCEAGYRLDEDRRGCTRELPPGTAPFWVSDPSSPHVWHASWLAITSTSPVWSHLLR